jgi:hypothetical protein
LSASSLAGPPCRAVPGLTAHRRHFLTAEDQVGLGRLPGFRDLVHQGWRLFF